MRRPNLKALLQASAALRPLLAAAGQHFVLLGQKERVNHFAKGRKA